MILVVDSSPLISLSILKRLDIIDQIFDEVYIPVAVYDEITKKNKPHSKELKKFATNRIKKIQTVLEYLSNYTIKHLNWPVKILHNPRNPETSSDDCP